MTFQNLDNGFKGWDDAKVREWAKEFGVEDEDRIGCAVTAYKVALKEYRQCGRKEAEYQAAIWARTRLGVEAKRERRAK